MFQELDYDSDNSSYSEIKGDLLEGQISQNELLSRRYIIHLDVDCFYCQCEEIANPNLATRPLAVGQKHIIVTSNYVARKMGVKKLQSRNDAMRACPSLIIIEGSDIEPYRDASRSIYDSFRSAVKDLDPKNATKKGGMDEFFADITTAVEEKCQKEQMNRRNLPNNASAPDDIWVYGNDAESSVVQITEDQSGATSTSTWTQGNSSEICGMDEERNVIIHKLYVAALMAKRIQGKVKADTHFSTSVGTSVSPMLAKIASDLKKPKSCNILFPWRSSSIIHNMPLRRVPDLGSRTLRTMIPTLQQYNREQDPDFWTCSHLLNVPRRALQLCMKRDKDGSLCDLLTNRCRGIDTLAIVDDGGGINKTVSVEDSFIRGSLTSMDGVIQNLNILFVRILRLLDKRKKSSKSPQDAYPRVLRLTARIVDRSITSRRPFRNISKQSSFNGKALMEMQNAEERIAILKKHTIPLLNILKEVTDGLNVTRLNLATASFADIGISHRNHCVGGKAQENVYSFFQSKHTTDKSSWILSNSEEVHEKYCDDSNGSDHNCYSPVLPIRNPTRMRDVIDNLKHKQDRKRTSALSKPKRLKNCNASDDKVPCRSPKEEQLPIPGEVDPSFLAALPPDIAREVLENKIFHRTTRTPSSKRKTGIETFFTRL